MSAQAEDLGLAALTPKQARGLAPAPLVADVSATPAGRDGLNATLIVARSHARALIPGVLELITEVKLAPERVTTVLASMDEAAAALNDHLCGGSTKTMGCRLTMSD